MKLLFTKEDVIKGLSMLARCTPESITITTGVPEIVGESSSVPQIPTTGALRGKRTSKKASTEQTKPVVGEEFPS